MRLLLHRSLTVILKNADLATRCCGQRISTARLSSSVEQIKEERNEDEEKDPFLKSEIRKYNLGIKAF